VNPLKNDDFVPGGVTSDIIFVLLMLFLLGFFLEWIGIFYIVLPLLWTILDKSGVDPVWFAILAGVNLQTLFLTPPVGWAMFFLKGVAPPEVRSKDICIGVMPFVALQLLGWCCCSCIRLSPPGCRKPSAGNSFELKPGGDAVASRVGGAFDQARWVVDQGSGVAHELLERADLFDIVAGGL
jgi:hypothetical protein